MPKKAVIAIVAAIILLVGGVFVYQVWQERQLTKQSDQNQPTFQDKIANWKIYRNEKYGFEIKYPQGWELLPPEGFLIKNPYEFVPGYQALGIIGFRLTDNGGLPEEITISVIRGNPKSIADVALKHRYIYLYNSKTEQNEVPRYDSFLFNDRIPAYRMWSTGEGTVNEGIFFEVSPGVTLGIEAISGYYSDEIKLDEETNRVLSTFRFLK